MINVVTHISKAKTWFRVGHQGVLITVDRPFTQPTLR
jgi:hypothetical protein